MDRRRELEETFEPVVARNEKIGRDIIKHLEPNNEGLHELKIDFEVKEEKCPQVRSKRRLVVADYDPLAEAFIRKYMDDIWIRCLVYVLRMENS